MASAEAALLWLRNLSPEAPRNKSCAFWCLFLIHFSATQDFRALGCEPRQTPPSLVAVFFVLCLSKRISNSARLQRAAPHLPTPLPVLGLQVCPRIVPMP